MIILTHTISSLAATADEKTSADPSAKSLDPNQFLCRAIKHGDEFRSLEALQLESSVPRLRAASAVADRLKLGATYLRDETEPPTPFQPTLTRTRRYSLGYETRFLTGTSLSTELRHDSVLIDFQQLPRSEYYETYGVVTLRQSLWADAFGSSTRLGLEAGELYESGNRSVYWAQAARQALDLLGAYSAAWIAQINLSSSRDALSTRNRYLGIVNKQRARGTVNRPEFLQVRSSVTSSEAAVDTALHELRVAWLSLVTASARSSDQWLVDDAEKFNLSISSPLELAKSACSQESKILPPPETTDEITGLSAQVEAARKTIQQIEGRNSPDLALTLALSSNGLDPNDRGQTLEEFARIENPAITAGFGLTIPLGDPALEAELAQARAQLQRLESQLSQARLQLRTGWQTACSNLTRLSAAVESRQRIVKDQNERVQALEARFRVGRSPAFDLIMAADDARGAQMALAATRRELFLASWQVLLVNQHLTELVRSLKSQEGCQ